MKKVLVLLGMVMLLALLIACTELTSNEDIVKEIVDESKSIILSEYTYENEFNESTDIESIIKDYNIEESENIVKMMYIPIIAETSDKITKKSKYTIKKLGSTDINEDVIYSSVFEAPGGVARVKRELKNKYTCDIKCKKIELEKALESTYKMDISNNYVINKEYDIEVDNGKKQSVKAYSINKQYVYEVNEKGETLGTGTLDRISGVLIVVSEK